MSEIIAHFFTRKERLARTGQPLSISSVCGYFARSDTANPPARAMRRLSDVSLVTVWRVIVYAFGFVS